MQAKVLTPSQVEQFIEYGYVKLDAAFSPHDALAVQDFLWGKLAERGVRKEDPSTWVEPIIRINEGYDDDVFQRCGTQRLHHAIEDLVGEGRYASSNKTSWGWWPVNFSLGADQPWNVPTRGWHWDGQHFRHFVNSPNQGLLLICVFSQIAPHGGGTLIAQGSHKIVARFLNQYPEGIELNDAIPQCTLSHPWLQELTGKTHEHKQDRVTFFIDTPYHDPLTGAELRVLDTPASPGDVYLCHPFLYHATAPNHSGKPRFMCNRCTPLRAPMQLNRPDGNYSPLEISIHNALY